MGDDGWGAASDNWPGHSVIVSPSSLREDEQWRTAEVNERCIVELYELQSGILDRELQIVQPFTDQGVGFLWLSESSALLAFRSSELADVSVRSSSQETCLYKLRHLPNGSALARSVLPDHWPKPRRKGSQSSVAKRLVLGALGGARAVERRAAVLPPPASSLRPLPSGRSDLNFAPPWQVNQEARQSALEHSVQVFAEGTGTNLAMSFMSSWERKIVHAEAERLHLLHWSEGEADNRRIILQKRISEGPDLSQPPLQSSESLPAQQADTLIHQPSAVPRYVPPALRRQKVQTVTPSE